MATATAQNDEIRIGQLRRREHPAQEAELHILGTQPPASHLPCQLTNRLDNVRSSALGRDLYMKAGRELGQLAGKRLPQLRDLVRAWILEAN